MIIRALKLLPVLLLFAPVSFALAAPQEITPAEYRQAFAFYELHGHDLLPIKRYSPAYQDMSLGSTYWLYGGKEYQELARRFLLHAVERPKTGKFAWEGYAQNMLGDIEKQLQHFDLAEQHYRQAIAVKDKDACVNLGAMWAVQNQYEKARKVYTDCLPTLKSPLLLLNLGTIYYKGLGITQDKKQGADYWQQSYDMFAYDPDVNYNLGLYHLNHTRDFAQARYHFALANSLGDLKAEGKMDNPELVGYWADHIFADELWRADKDQRLVLLQDRLLYTLEKRYLGTARDGMTFALSKDCKLLRLSGTPKNAEARERAINRCSGCFTLIAANGFH